MQGHSRSCSRSCTLMPLPPESRTFRPVSTATRSVSNKVPCALKKLLRHHLLSELSCDESCSTSATTAAAFAPQAACQQILHLQRLRQRLRSELPCGKLMHGIGRDGGSPRAPNCLSKSSSSTSATSAATSSLQAAHQQGCVALSVLRLIVEPRTICLQLLAQVIRTSD